MFTLLTILACRPESAVEPDRIRFGLTADPPSLNPLVGNESSGYEVEHYLFESLIDLNPDTLEYRPKIAERWEISDDHKTYTFYLRKNVKWHDGVPLTADDVLFSYNLIMDAKTDDAFLKIYYKDITSVEKLDDYTVRFHYGKIYFKALDFCGGIPILPKHILEHDPDINQSHFNRAPVGNGPYRFASWDTGKKIVLTRNEDYWDKKPEIKTIEYKIVSDPSVAFQLLKKGDLDQFGLRIVQWVKQTDSEKFNAHFQKLKYTGHAYSYIGWNENKKFFADVRVRRAMTMLIDIEKLRTKLFYALVDPLYSPFHPKSPQYNPGIKPLPYDVAGAKKILTEAGWADSDGDGWLDKDGVKFKFTILFPSVSTSSDRIATIIKEDFKKVGIDMDIARLEWTAYLDKMDAREFDATISAWTMPFEGDPYQLWHSSQAKENKSSDYIGFADPRLDPLMEAARVEFDTKKRNELYWKFQEILYDDQPYTFLYVMPSMEAVSRRFTNVVVHKAGTDPLEWKITTP